MPYLDNHWLWAMRMLATWSALWKLHANLWNTMMISFQTMHFLYYYMIIWFAWKAPGRNDMGTKQKTTSWKRPAGDSSSVVCQKCLQKGHWTYECKNEAAYRSRPSRTKELLRPKQVCRLFLSQKQIYLCSSLSVKSWQAFIHILQKKSLLDANEVPKEFRSPTELYHLEREKKEHERMEKKRQRSRSTSSDSRSRSISRSYSSTTSSSSGTGSSSYTSGTSSSEYTSQSGSSEYTSRSHSSYSK